MYNVPFLYYCPKQGMFMTQLHRRIMVGVCGLALVAGCANTPEKDDPTPKNDTSVVRATFSVNGGFVPDISGTQTVYTRPNMRRIDTTTEFDSFMMRWANSDISDIFRIDRNLLWMLDNDARSYQECPLSGCIVNPLFPASADEREEDEEEYETYEDRQCQVTLTANDFSVEATGHQRLIGGLRAGEYVVRWQTTMKDKQGRTDTNLLQFVLWTVPPTEDMSKAWRVHSVATNNYLDAVGENNLLVRILGRQGFKTIGSFVGDIEKTDEHAYSMWLDELAQIKGYPLSVKMEWFQRHETCPEAKKRNSTDVDLSKGLDGLKDAATGLVRNVVSDKKEELLAEWKKKPRVRYVYEVNSVAEQRVHDSTFMLPEGYVLSDRQ